VFIRPEQKPTFAILAELPDNIEVQVFGPKEPKLNREIPRHDGKVTNLFVFGSYTGGCFILLKETPSTNPLYIYV
jgi:hypothetical protein